MDTKMDKMVPVRLLPDELNALRVWSGRHDRSLSEEVRLAVRLLLCEHGIARIQTPEGRAEALAEGFDPDADLQEYKKRLKLLRERAFSAPGPRPSALAAGRAAIK